MTAASTMSGGEAVVRSLIANGIDTIFGLPGVQLDHFFNALHDHGNELRVLNARHEQGPAYMAFGRAQSAGRIGASAVVPGPGPERHARGEGQMTSARCGHGGGR